LDCHSGASPAQGTGIYNRAKYIDEMHEALDRWADHVSRIVAVRPKSLTLRRVVAANVGSAQQ
jgi:hypothetical protein